MARSKNTRDASRRSGADSSIVTNGHILENQSVALPQEPTLNFGNGLTAFDDGPNAKSTLVAGGLVVEVSSNYVVLDEDTVILVDASAGAVQVTLPATANYRVYTIKSLNNGAAFNVTVIGTAGALIDKQTSQVIGAGGWLQCKACDATGDYAVIGRGSVVGTPASWPITTTRIFALDYDAGSDANAGYSDVSMAAAGLVAKKTWEGIEAILPTVGAGRSFIIAIKNRAAGAVYLKQDGITVADLIFRGYVGYGQMRIIATSDFSDNATDQIKSGCTISTAGPNGDGSWTCAAAGTAALFAVDAAQSLPAESTIVGRRIRWTGNVTAALANRTTMIWKSFAGLGGAITPNIDLNVAPAAGDTFFIEKAGVAFNRVSIGLEGASTMGATASTANNFFELRGIAATVNAARSFTVSGPGRNVYATFCEDRGGTSSSLRFDNIGSLWVRELAPDSVGSFTVRVGVGFYFTGSLFLIDSQSVTMGCYCATKNAASALFLSRVISLSNFGLSSVHYTAQMAVFASTLPATIPSGGLTNTIGSGSAVTSSRPLRVEGVTTNSAAITFDQSSGALFGIEFSNCTVPLVEAWGVGVNVSFDGCVGSTGNTSVFAELTGARNSTFTFGARTANTASGTLGNVRLAGNALTTQANLALTNVIDNQGNKVMGSAGFVTGQAGMLVTNIEGSTLSLGDVVHATGTANVVKSRADTAAHAKGPLMVMLTSPVDLALGYAVPLGQGSWVLTDGVLVASDLLYLSEATAGHLTNVVPPAAATNQKLRVGFVEDINVPSGLARVVGSPELLSLPSDGVAP